MLRWLHCRGLKWDFGGSGKEKCKEQGQCKEQEPHEDQEPHQNKDCGSGSALLKGFETQGPALPAGTFELSRNPVVTQSHGPEVTLSATQITDVKPSWCWGWMGSVLTPRHPLPKRVP